MYRLFGIVLAIVFGGMACQSPTVVPDGFEIEDGFELRLVASEPLIKDPVDMDFNEKGDAFVLEMPGYPFEDQQSRLMVLTDEDGDGVYDKSSVFADKLQLATSFLPYKKGALVAAPPYLLFVRDDNEDYLVDKVDTLMGGFATGNLQHNYNGLTFGLDGWIYAANGGNDGSPYWWDEPDKPMNLRGQDFRFHLETKTIERLGESSGGFELAIDDYDRIFETHNLVHISHLVFPHRYAGDGSLITDHSLTNVSDHEENGLSRIYPIGEQESRVNHPEQSGYFSGACGITFYGGGAFGEEYANTVWVADVVLNLVHIDKIRSMGAAFEASRIHEKKDFLASEDRSFRPVNMTVGPDGEMYVVDMYREVIEHPEWIPDEIEKTLDLEAGKDKGRIYKVSSAISPAPFDFAQFQSETGLITALSHTNQWVRRTAHRLLLDEPLSSESTQRLQQLLIEGSSLAKVHALYILSVQGQLSTEELTAALSDASPDVTVAALILAEKQVNAPKELLDACQALLTHANSRVRMQAALTMSISTFAGEEILRDLQTAAEMPLDDWNIVAITLAAKNHAAGLFDRLVSTPRPNSRLLASLALNANQKTDDARTVLIGLHTAQITSNEKRMVLEYFTKRAGALNGLALQSHLRLFEETGDLELLPALAALRKRLNLPPSKEFLAFSRSALQLATDGSLADSVRLQHLALLELLPYNEKAEVLFQCLTNDQPLKVQENALRQLSQVREVEVGQRIVAMWSEFGPQTRRFASDLLLYREIHHDALLTGLENKTINIGEMNFDLERRRTLLWWTDVESTRRRAEQLFGDEGVSTRQEVIDQMKPALAMVGSEVDGAKVFESTCSTCHKYGELGIEVGPVLTEINRKSKETLMHDILDPNAAADSRYINHRLETQEGLVHVGIVSAETDRAFTILKVGGEEVTVQKSDVKSFRSLGTSMMMEGLENGLSHQDMADLLAFLQRGV